MLYAAWYAVCHMSYVVSGSEPPLWLYSSLGWEIENGKWLTHLQLSQMMKMILQLCKVILVFFNGPQQAGISK